MDKKAEEVTAVVWGQLSQAWNHAYGTLNWEQALHKKYFPFAWKLCKQVTSRFHILRQHRMFFDFHEAFLNNEKH